MPRAVPALLMVPVTQPLADHGLHVAPPRPSPSATGHDHVHQRHTGTGTPPAGKRGLIAGVGRGLADGPGGQTDQPGHAVVVDLYCQLERFVGPADLQGRRLPGHGPTTAQRRVPGAGGSTSITVFRPSRRAAPAKAAADADSGHRFETSQSSSTTPRATRSIARG